MSGAKATTPENVVRITPLWKPIAAIAACLTYVVVFYAVAPDDNPKDVTVLEANRILAWLYLILPDQLMGEWIGNDWSRFGIVDRVPLLAAAACLLFIAYATGRLLLRAVRADRVLSRVESTLFSLGIGLNCLSLYILSMGVVGQIQNAIIFFTVPTFIVGYFGFGCYRSGSFFTATSSCPEGNSEVKTVNSAGSSSTKIAKWCLVAGVCVMIAFVVLGSMLPPWYFDVREYHSQVPREWFVQGRITFLPHNVYGNMPQGAAIHGIPAMIAFNDWWQGALVGKLMIGTFAGMTAFMLVAAGYRFFTPWVGWIAAFVYMSTPWVQRLSTTGMIDIVVGFYCVSALYALLLARNQTLKWPLMTVAGFLAGASVACKYPSLLFIVVPLFVASAIYGVRDRLPLRSVGIQLAGFSIAVAVACGPWFAKNAVLAGNPTYPLLYEVFGGETRTPEKAERWRTAHRTPQNAFSIAEVRRTAMLIWTSGYLGPCLFPLAAVGLFASGYRREVVLLTAVTGFGIVAWWLLTHRLDRFLLPFLPLVALLAGLSITAVKHAAWRSSIVVALLLSFVTWFISANSRATCENRYFVSLADLREDVPREEDAFWSHYSAAHRDINDTIPPKYNVMLVGDAQVFDVRRPAIYNTCFDDCVLEQLLKGKSRNERYEVLRARKISHIFVFWRELERYRKPGNYGYSDFATHELVSDELVAEQKLLRAVSHYLEPQGEDITAPRKVSGELFEVVGWQDW